MPTPLDLLSAAARRDSSRPLLTWYDDATGERVELSVATTVNWAAKTANLLLDDDVERVRLDPSAHWLALVVALGAWTAGAAVADDGVALPADTAEFTATVLPQPDVLMSAAPDEGLLALSYAGREWTLGELGAAALHAAQGHGVQSGARVMSTLPLDTVDGLDATLLVPLAVDGSVVWVAHADEARLARRAQDERVTLRLP